MGNADSANQKHMVDAVVTLVIPMFELAHADDANGDTYSIGELTSGLDWRLLRVGDKVRLEVDSSNARVLYATLLEASPRDPSEQEMSQDSTLAFGEDVGDLSGDGHRPRVAPADFPRPSPSIDGSMSSPAVALRRADGQHTDRLTDDELYERYELCDGMAQHVTDYCRRKLAMNPRLRVHTLLRRLKRGVLALGWDMRVSELDWVINRVEFSLAQQELNGFASS